MYIGLQITTRSPLPENFLETLMQASTPVGLSCPDTEVLISQADDEDSRVVSVYGVDAHTSLSGFVACLNENNIEPWYLEEYIDAEEEWAEGEWEPVDPTTLQQYV